MCVDDMARYSSYSNNEPLTRWNNIPIYLTTILTAVFVAGFLFRALSQASNSLAWFFFAFTMPLDPSWSVWRVATYVVLDPVSFFTPFSILCFYWWSIGIETHLGRETLVKLLALLVLTAPAVCIFWYWGMHLETGVVGSEAFIAGLLIAFATLYPNSEAWGWIPFKWLAFACIFTGSLMLFAGREWSRLSELWASCAVGFAYMNHAKEMEHDDTVSIFDRLGKWFQRKPKFRVLSSPSPRARQSSSAETNDLDALLDKISRNGMDSLTKQERAKLERLREALLKKDQR
jgi:hypothetical protein